MNPFTSPRVAQLPTTHSEPLSEESLWAQLDQLERDCPDLLDAPTDASDIAAELNGCRIPADQRITERPGAEWEWNR